MSVTQFTECSGKRARAENRLEGLKGAIGDKGGPMGRKTILVTALAVAFVGAFAMPATASARRYTSQVVVMPAGTEAVPGAWARLVTNDSGASATIHTRQLEADAAYTVWWVVFNNPAACTKNPSGPILCGASDLGTASVQASVLYATGHVVGNDGAASFGAHLAVGDTDGALFGPGLTNPAGAEIHLIVRTHGPAVPGYVDEQIGTFNGGCNAGEPNEGLCMNKQAAPFAQ